MTKFADTRGGPSRSRWSISLIVQPDVLAARGIIGGIEAATDVALGRGRAGVMAERIVEATEVRQIGDVGHQAFHPGRESLAFALAALFQPRGRSPG